MSHPSNAAGRNRADIERVLGTPNEEVWPGVTSLPDYKDSFPQWSPTDLGAAVRGLDEHGLDLLQQMMMYDPAVRISGQFTTCHVFVRRAQLTV